jgi:hypothetical protein
VCSAAERKNFARLRAARAKTTTQETVDAAAAVTAYIFSFSLYVFYPHVCRIIGSKLIERERELGNI